ncbi:MAG: carbamoyltransferase [Acidobacteriota bacterium]
MTAILGISAFYHDSAAALVVDGRIAAAAQEERFSRIKHDAAFPHQATQWCLQHAGLTAGDLDYVAFYDKPLLKFDRLLETYLAFAPAGLASFSQAMPLWLHKKLHLPREMRAALGGDYRRRFVFPEHHESHAASAFFPSPFQDAAILTLDGVGEWATAICGHGQGNRLEISHELRFPHSLGLLYSAFTYFCGFRVNSGEYKLMGLAPYGDPKYVQTILDHVVDLKEDGSLRLDLSYFQYCQGLRMTSKRMDGLFDGPPRAPESPITQREMDLAASIQRVTEEAMLRSARHLHRITGSKNLCLAGGVALNCVGNGRILREGPFEKVWIQPAAGDAGGALGAALFVWHQLLDQPRTAEPLDSMAGARLGPSYGDDEIAQVLDSEGARYTTYEDDEALCQRVAELLEQGRVVGWFQGAMEFGPRALGCRSILGDARSSKMQAVMNLKIKFRESFRPFAPVVLEEHAHRWFDLQPEENSPYMLLVAPVREERRQGGETLEKAKQGEGPSGPAELPPAARERLRQVRGQIPAVTHVDFSARVQTVDAHRHGRFHTLLNAFHQRTDCPVLINTSFNVRGEPIVESPEQAYRCFRATGMDVLVLEHHVLLEEDQADAKVDREAYLAQFHLD